MPGLADFRFVSYGPVCRSVGAFVCFVSVDPGEALALVSWVSPYCVYSDVHMYVYIRSARPRGTCASLLFTNEVRVRCTYTS